MKIKNKNHGEKKFGPTKICKEKSCRKNEENNKWREEAVLKIERYCSHKTYKYKLYIYTQADIYPYVCRKCMLVCMRSVGVVQHICLALFLSIFACFF